jgi:hypothetical protein
MKTESRLDSTLNIKVDVQRLFIPETAPKKLHLRYDINTWLKITALVDQCPNEIAWHGVVTRESEDSFKIVDVLVYPQSVTGATVQSIEPDYTNWLMAHDDAVFNNIRMQGHSHVNMGVTPSGVDMNQMNGILEQEPEYYIFQIMNKRGQIWTEIHLPEFNAIYETADIVVYQPGFINWAQNKLKEFVQQVKPATTVHYGVTGREVDLGWPYTTKPETTSIKDYLEQKEGHC